ncbi:class II glutamine amidotransferase [Halomonas caseinilytica]|uniref:class II glutamine amidotransferase n=1 Tax=Halomonas caseinilytica TaxID=438744 RepID=UPI00084913A1|nr:class II glutamine amidotransferase [Halomonas caseinilytica]
MCELLGMSANVPTDICFSFSGFLHRGGGTGPHRDGWGIAFYEAGGYRDFRDPHPSVDSPIARLICDYPIKSHVVISHIRQANVGEVRLANTHPFTREMWGRPWCYAHNGQLSREWSNLPLSFYRPVGTTDSEHAFCWLMGELRRAFPDPPDDPEALWQYLHRLCEHLRTYGVFNLLLADGEHLYTYCSTKLAHITRRAPFGRASLSDAELAVNFAEHTTPDDVVSVIATEPLTDNEDWVRMMPGELLVWRDGDIQGRYHT